MKQGEVRTENIKLSTGEAFDVEIYCPTEGELRRMHARASGAIGLGGDIDVEKFLEHQAHVLTEWVRGISLEHLGVKIEDGASLAEFGSTELVDRVFEVVSLGGRLLEEDAKK